MENKIKTRLKEIDFFWDESNKELLIGRDKVTFAVPKKYLFSLNRFILRIAQKNFKTKRNTK
jgi:hypothetical protein